MLLEIYLNPNIATPNVTGIKDKVVVDVQGGKQHHKEEGEVMLQKIREKVESVVKLCNDQTKELMGAIQNQLYTNEQEQDKIQQELQLWNEQLEARRGDQQCEEQQLKAAAVS